MGSQLIGDPGAQESEGAEMGIEYAQVVNGDSVILPIGALVEIIIPFPGSATTAFLVQRSATTADFLLLGIVSGAAIPVGGSGRVTVEGVALANFDGSTTEGHVAVQSTGTAGDCTDDASAVAYKTIGAILQTITGAGQAYVYVHKA